MEIGLENGAVLGINGSEQAFVLRCLAGCLWLTRSGDSRDYFLVAGKTMEFGRNDAVVVEAWGDARLLFADTAERNQEGMIPRVWHLAGTP